MKINKKRSFSIIRSSSCTRQSQPTSILLRGFYEKAIQQGDKVIKKTTAKERQTEWVAING